MEILMLFQPDCDIFYTILRDQIITMRGIYMNKKLLSLLASVLLIAALTACSGESADAATSATSETAQAVENTTAPTVPETEASFEEIVLVDNDDCTVKITSIDEDNIWGYTLNVYLENKTDLELMFSLDNVSVNGYMCDPFWASTVASGMKANEEISFMESDFEKNGITDVEEITFTLSVYDSNDWLADHLVDETFTINP